MIKRQVWFHYPRLRIHPLPDYMTATHWNTRDSEKQETEGKEQVGKDYTEHDAIFITLQSKQN